MLEEVELSDVKKAGKPKRHHVGEYLADEHLADLNQIEQKLEVKLNLELPASSGGLSQEEADHRLLKYGKNILTPPKEVPEIVKFLMQFTNLFMVLLLVAGVLCCIAYALNTSDQLNLWLGIVLFLIVIFQCTESYIQERKSSKAMAAFKTMLPSQCRVVRNGKEFVVKAENLVPGDLVHIITGDKIPADLRVIAVNQAKVECSSITGESEPVTLTLESTSENPLETKNLMFNSSLCLDGEAYGIVIRTGDNTLIGRIASLTAGTNGQLTPLQKEVKYFVKVISIIAFIMAVIFFIIGIARGKPILETFVNGFIIVIVANVPQGLPATVTSCLTITANRLAKKNVFIKSLSSVETLGSATVIASDKTGTLTQNKMTVANVWFDSGAIPAETCVNDLGDERMKTFQKLYRTAALCNRARYQEDLASESTERIVLGDASETALFNFCELVRPVEKTRQTYPKVFEIPFNSTNKWQLSIHKKIYPDEENKPPKRLLVMKGAPEIIITKCTHYMIRGERIPITSDFKNTFQAAYEQFGHLGERVLGLAELKLDIDQFPPSMDSEYHIDKKNYPCEGLTFIGLTSMLDPPKKGVVEAVAKCRSAGIRVVMVTGDHPFTAEAIAKKVGIITLPTTLDIAKPRGVEISKIGLDECDVAVMHGSQLDDLSDEEWASIIKKKEIVFARTSPQQKLEIVTKFQEDHQIVAVTGDGVNDSPALKKADIGVAMGLKGSDVAKEAADVILMDDNFASIVVGIEEGRLIFDNLKKTVAYTLTHLGPEIFPVLCNLAFSLPLGISSILILCIDLGTELAPAISLAYEYQESDIMHRPPRSQKDRMVSFPVLSYSYLQAGIIETLACFLAFFSVFWYHGVPSSILPLSSDTYWKSGAPDLYIDNELYDADRQVNILAEAQCAWFITLVMSQMSHIWMCKTRTRSLFTHKIKNKVTNYGVLISIGICCLLVYLPPLQPYIGTANVHGYFWLPWLGSATVLWVWNEGRKAWVRKHSDGFIARNISW